MAKAPGRARLRRFQEARWDEPIIFEMSREGERAMLVPGVEEEVLQATLEDDLVPGSLRRKRAPALPELGQMQVLRHFLRLSQETMGTDITIDIGLGTCTMKYSPKIHEVLVRSPKMTELHPYQDEETVQGILGMIYDLEQFLKEISGMDRFSLQPSSGSQAIYSNASIVRAYHEANGELEQRDEVITTIFSHPSNPGAASTAGFKVVTLMPDESGLPDFRTLKASVSSRTAALFITNPEDTGIFNDRIRDYVDLVHSVGGLCCYDQANANGLFGITRAREAGFDMCHFNLHKSFSSPHGSHGPGAGAQGVTERLARFLPKPTVEYDGNRYYLDYDRPDSIGKLRKFYGVPPVLLRAYAYIASLGEEGLRRAAQLSVLNNNYMVKRLLEIPGLSCPMGEGKRRMEQARLSWEGLKEETGVGTDCICRRAVDYGLQTYFASHHPWLVPEPFTPEPPETYSKDDIDEYVAIMRRVAEEARTDPDMVCSAPHNSVITLVDPEPLVNVEGFACTWRAYKKKGKKGG